MGILRDTIDNDGQAGPAATSPPGGAGSAPPIPAPLSALAVAASPTAASPAAAPQASVPPASASQADGRSDLQRRRDQLAEQVTELHWDLGGLAYEMAIRDHFRLDVLVRRAALLQERDAELAEVERLLRMELDGVAGSCPSCAAPHSRGAQYCWQCGTTLMERLPSSTAISGQ
ncbi:MAG: hypothetical protein ACLPUT_02040 [Solirubrobacteraceae bacterium]